MGNQAVKVYLKMRCVTPWEMFLGIGLGIMAYNSVIKVADTIVELAKLDKEDK